MSQAIIPTTISQDIFSMVFSKRPNKTNPQFQRTKSNILLLLLVLLTYGMYSLFREFLNTIVLGFITGIAYQQARNKFITFMFNMKIREQNTSKGTTLLLLISLLIMPWLHTISHVTVLHPSFFEVQFILECIRTDNNTTLRFVQICIIAHLAWKIMRNMLPEEVTIERSQRKEEAIKIGFAIIIVGVCIAAIVVVPTMILNEGQQIVKSATIHIEDMLECELFKKENIKIINESNANEKKTFKPGEVWSHSVAHEILSQIIVQNITRQSCFQKVFPQNSEWKNIIQKITSPTQTGVFCLNFLIQKQIQYFGRPAFGYEEQVCAWVSLFQRITPHFTQSTNLFTAGKNFSAIFLTKCLQFLTLLSNSLFALTTFFTIFFTTVQLFNPQQNSLLKVFRGRGQMLDQISILIQGTCILVIYHFLLSFFLLQLFCMTPANFLLSALLGLIAFVPVFKPYVFATMIAVIRFMLQSNPLPCICFALLYMVVSGRIYSASLYDKLQLYQVLTSMSVLFGIYSFGVSGIFYGPIIIILFKYVHLQLFRAE